MSACKQVPVDEISESIEQTDAAPDAQEVVNELREFGLPVIEVSIVTAETDEDKLLGQPGQYTSKVNFYDARYPKSDDDFTNPINTLEVFANEEDAKARHDSIEDATRGYAFLAEYLVLDGVNLARFDKALSPEEVTEYKAALK